MSHSHHTGHQKYILTLVVIVVWTMPFLFLLSTFNPENVCDSNPCYPVIWIIFCCSATTRACFFFDVLGDSQLMHFWISNAFHVFFCTNMFLISAWETLFINIVQFYTEAWFTSTFVTAMVRADKFTKLVNRERLHTFENFLQNCTLFQQC